jgi:hypothetical protein
VSNVAPLKAPEPKADAPFKDLPLTEQVAKLREVFRPGQPNPFKVGDIIRFRPEVRLLRHKDERDELYVVLAVRPEPLAWANLRITHDEDLLLATVRFNKEWQSDGQCMSYSCSSAHELVDRASDPRLPATPARSPGHEG